MTGTDIYAGISGVTFTEPEIDLGYGVVLRNAYAYVFASPMVAFARAEAGRPHPAPWKAARGGVAHEILSELFVPAQRTAKIGSVTAVARAIVFVLRIGVNPAAALTVLSNKPLAATSDSEDWWVLADELEARRFALAVDRSHAATNPPNAAAGRWVAEHWPTAVKFISESAEFALAVDALSIGQYVHRSALTIVSIWAALEALFSPSTSELKFRVSALIAAYLEPPGSRRRQRATEVAKLYDKRSAAAHGKPSHDTEHVVASFELLRQVLTKMLDERKIPSKAELEGLLYGSTHEGAA